MKKLYTMRQAVEDPDLLGALLAGDTWRTWRIILIAAMGEPLTFWERRTFAKFTGRKREPGKIVDELVAVAGRRAGKSRASSVLALYLSALCDYSDVKAIGERPKCLFLAKNQEQAKICFSYCAGAFESVPLLREIIINKTQDTISLSNGVDLEVKAASAAGLRGFSCVAVLADEAAHWTTDSASANADTEILNAVRPSLATTGGPLLILSSPFARKGEVFDLWDKHYGQKGDPAILVCHGASRDFNTSLSKAVVDRALARNPIAARAEWLAEFRSDLEGFVSLDILRACVGPVAEWQPMPGIKYTAGVDFASGSGEDSLALAFGHHDPASDRVIIDFVKEWTPPFSPSAALTEVAGHCRRYGVDTLIGDRFGGDFPREILRNLGVGYRISDKTTSACFSELGPLLNSREILLPQHQIAIDQLGALERKPSSRGKEFIGHPPGGHDDAAAAIAVAAAHCDFWKGDKVYLSMIDAGGRLISNEGGVMRVVQLGEDGEPQDHLDPYAEARRRSIVRTGNLDCDGKPIDATPGRPVVPAEPRIKSNAAGLM